MLEQLVDVNSPPGYELEDDSTLNLTPVRDVCELLNPETVIVAVAVYGSFAPDHATVYFFSVMLCQEPPTYNFPVMVYPVPLDELEYSKSDVISTDKDALDALVLVAVTSTV